MDWPTLWAIVHLSWVPKIQISTNLSRQKHKTSLVCIEIKIGENGIFSQLIKLTNRAFRYPGLAQGDRPPTGP